MSTPHLTGGARNASVSGVLCLLLLTLLASSACGRGDGSGGATADTSSDADGATQSAAETFYKAGLSGISTDLANIREDFGDGDSIKARAVQNRHVPTQTDSVITRHYKGFDVVIYRISTDGKELLSSIRVMDNKYISAAAPVRVGMAAADLAVVMGAPTESNDSVFTYTCTTCSELGNEHIEVRWTQGLVTAVTIFYPID